MPDGVVELISIGSGMFFILLVVGSILQPIPVVHAEDTANLIEKRKDERGMLSFIKI